MAASQVGASSFLPSDKSTLVLSASWALLSGLQFTSRMAPQPLGPQTQFFCKDDGNVGSGRVQVNPLLPRCLPLTPHRRQSQVFLQGDGNLQVRICQLKCLTARGPGTKSKEHCLGGGPPAFCLGSGQVGTEDRLTGTANSLLLLAAPPGVAVNQCCQAFPFWLRGPGLHPPLLPHLSPFVTRHLHLPTAVDVHIQGDLCNGRERSAPGLPGGASEPWLSPRGCPRPAAGPPAFGMLSAWQRKFLGEGPLLARKPGEARVVPCPPPSLLGTQNKSTVVTMPLRCLVAAPQRTPTWTACLPGLLEGSWRSKTSEGLNTWPPQAPLVLKDPGSAQVSPQRPFLHLRFTFSPPHHVSDQSQIWHPTCYFSTGNVRAMETDAGCPVSLAPSSGPDAGHEPGTLLGPRGTAACQTGPFLFTCKDVCASTQAAGGEDVSNTHTCPMVKVPGKEEGDGAGCLRLK